MKIYQLHECGGEWEDYHDCIIGSYLRKERAEEEKAIREAKEKELVEHSKKCCRCPFVQEDFDSLDNLLAELSDYCEHIFMDAAPFIIEDLQMVYYEYLYWCYSL